MVIGVVDRPAQLAFALPGRRAQRAFGVADHRGGLAHRVLGEVGQFTGDALHRCLRLIALLRAAQIAACASNRAGSAPRRAAPVPRRGAGGATGGFDPRHGASVMAPIALASSPESVG